MAINDASHCDLVERAKAGDARSLELLAVEVQRRVCAYANRVLLDSHRAEDLAQDTVAAVLRSLPDFRQVDRFWPWVFTIASNNVRQHFRRQMLRKVVPMSNVDESLLQSPSDADKESVRHELAELTQKAMSQVGERHRMVLALRFYEDLPHAEIARALGCTELGARVVFHRAKLALLRELKRLGVSKTMLTTALAAFGWMTLGRSAQGMTVIVSSTAASEGVLTGLLTTKIKVAVAAVFMAGALSALPLLNVQAISTGKISKGTVAQNVIPGSVVRHGPPLYVHMISRGLAIAYKASGELWETWYYYPHGVGGPILLSNQLVDEKLRDSKEWSWRAADGPYHFNGINHVVERRNALSHCIELHTEALPTDSNEFAQFIDATEGEFSHAFIPKSGYSIERDPTTGYVTGGEDFRPTMKDTFRFTVTYEAPKGFDPFEFQLPQGWKLEDKRDALHQQGWAFFRIEGDSRGEKVSGVGRVPLVYNQSVSRPMWVKLNVGGRMMLQDDGVQAVVLSVDGAVLAHYPGGTFFRGLSRPWEGFHTADSIRRDAAASQLRYKCSFVPEDPAQIQVTVEKGQDEATKWWLRHVVDDKRDLLTQIRYRQGPGQNVTSRPTFVDSIAGKDAGLRSTDNDKKDPVNIAGDTSRLTFIYLEGIAEDDPEFSAPQRVNIPPSMRARTGDLFWLIEAPQVMNGAAGE